ncbi:MAG: PH domain-containing protein [Lachnospiraceae bacterium]|nr:PH domain-containing protein [Lachnospiraceae bacterium]
MEFKERKRWLFFGLPFTFTTYTVTEDMLTIDSGILTRIENDCYMYKIIDVKLETSLLERIFKLGTIICYTGDTTHPELRIMHIKNAKAIKNFILEVSETARKKRRTLNTLDIGGGGIMDDVDSIE